MELDQAIGVMNNALNILARSTAFSPADFQQIVGAWETISKVVAPVDASANGHKDPVEV